MKKTEKNDIDKKTGVVFDEILKTNFRNEEASREKWFKTYDFLECTKKKMENNSKKIENSNYCAFKVEEILPVPPQNKKINNLNFKKKIKKNEKIYYETPVEPQKTNPFLHLKKEVEMIDKKELELLLDDFRKENDKLEEQEITEQNQTLKKQNPLFRTSNWSYGNMGKNLEIFENGKNRIKRYTFD